MASDDPIKEAATWLGSGIGGGLIGYIARLWVVERGKLRLDRHKHDQIKALKEADAIMAGLTEEGDYHDYARYEKLSHEWRKRLAAGEFGTEKKE
jgi:hypothetical protein